MTGNTRSSAVAVASSSGAAAAADQSGNNRNRTLSSDLEGVFNTYLGQHVNQVTLEPRQAHQTGYGVAKAANNKAAEANVGNG